MGDGFTHIYSKMYHLEVDSEAAGHTPRHTRRSPTSNHGLDPSVRVLRYV